MQTLSPFVVSLVAFAAACSTQNQVNNVHQSVNSASAQRSTACPAGGEPTGMWPAPPALGEGLWRGCLLTVDQRRVRHGAWLLVEDEGGKRMYTYDRGLLTGPHRRWNPKGRLLVKGRLVKGVREGPWAFYYGDGVTTRVVDMVGGRQELPVSCSAGTVKKTRRGLGGQPGVLFCVEPGGKPHGPFVEWHSNGLVKVATGYHQGKRHGPYQTWRRSGVRQLVAVLAAGKPVGSSQHFDASGQLESVSTWGAGGLRMTLAKRCAQWRSALTDLADEIVENFASRAKIELSEAKELVEGELSHVLTVSADADAKPWRVRLKGRPGTQLDGTLVVLGPKGQVKEISATRCTPLAAAKEVGQ